jgi:hypothetical protein
MKFTIDIPESYAYELLSMTCGNNPCAFYGKRPGQVTNGGCRCPTDQAIQQHHRAIQHILHRIAHQILEYTDPDAALEAQPSLEAHRLRRAVSAAHMKGSIMSEQTATSAIDEHIAWLEERIKIEGNVQYHTRDAWMQGMMAGVMKSLREALDHARAAQERSGE